AGDRPDGRGYRYFTPRQPARRTHGVARARRRLHVPDADGDLRHGLPADAPVGTQRDRPVAGAASDWAAAADAAVGGARPRLFANRPGGNLHGSQETRPGRLTPDMGSTRRAGRVRPGFPPVRGG